MKRLFKWFWGLFSGSLLMFIVFLYNKVLVARVTASISGSIIDKVVSFFGSPFITLSKQPGLKDSDWDKWIYIIKVCGIEILFLIGVVVVMLSLGYLGYSSYTKKKLTWDHPELLAQREYAIAVATVEDPTHTEYEAKIAVEQMIEAFNNGMSKLFSLKEKKFRSFWLVADDKGYETYSKNGFLEKQDKDAIQKAFKHEDTIYDDDLTKRGYSRFYNGKYIFFIRNEGVFKLAYVLIITDDITVSDKLRNEFSRAVSSMILLGHVDGICKTMLQLAKDAREVK